MTTEISENLTQYAGKTGLEYQITVKREMAGLGGVFGYVCLTKAELDKLVLDYITHQLAK